MPTLSGTAQPEALLPQSTDGVANIRAIDDAGRSVKITPTIRSITDYGAVSGATAGVNTPFFNAAIAAGNNIYVPAGTWRWTGTLTATDVVWYIDKDAVFPDAPTSGTNAAVDLSTLGGRIFLMDGTSSRGGFRVGSGSAWLESFRDFSITISEFCVVSSKGGYGIIGASRASDNLPSNFQTIGVGGFAYNDNTTNKEPAWAAYFETGRVNGAGAALGIEIDVWTASAADPLTPYSTRTSASMDAIGAWLSAGGGSGAPGTNKNSAAVGIHANGQRHERGIVFLNNAIDATVNEAMSLYKGLKLAWYDSTNIAQSYITGDDAKFINKSDTAALGHETAYVRKRANGTTATGALDEVHVDRGAGWDGSAEYYGTYIQHLQRGNFSGGNARFSLDLGAKNDSGTYREVSLNGIANDSFAPNADNALNFGTGSFRWKELFAGNATVNTSDAALKTDIRALTEAERRVGEKCGKLFKAYRWKDAVAEKGDAARIHFGVIAQEVAAAFEAEGLDPFAYGMLCRDEIEEMREVIITVPVQKTVLEITVTKAVEIIDGRAVKVTKEVDTYVPQFEELPVWDEDGSPVMEPIYKRVVKENVIDGEVKKEVVRKQIGERRVIHTVPIMVETQQTTHQLVKTGEYRMGVRYSELFAFIMAAT